MRRPTWREFALVIIGGEIGRGDVVPTSFGSAATRCRYQPLSPAPWIRTNAAGTASTVAEDLVQLRGELLRLARVAELSAHEAAVMAREDDRLVAEQLGGGDRRATGEGVERL